MKSKEEHINIDFLLTKYVSGEASEEEIQTITNWVHNSSDNINKLIELRNTVSVIKNVSSHNVFNPQQAFGKCEEKIKNNAKKNNIRSLFLYTSTIAALFIVLFGIYFFITSKEDFTTVAITTNFIDDIVLEDGSNITLNKNSRLEIAKSFNTKERVVNLKGEAFFEVTPNKQKPFIVNIEDIIVKVVGTSFNIGIDTSLKTIIVTVKTGTVEVISKQGEQIINAGEQICYNKNTEKLETTNIDIQNSDSWKTGVLEFNNTNLEIVINSLNKNFNTNFSIGSNELKDKKIFAKFYKTDDKERIRKTLNILLNAETTEKNDSLIIYSIF